MVLPCRLSPEHSAQDMEVTWFRDQFTPFVHRYRDGQDHYGDQEIQYQGRTEMLKDGLANGSVDLRIFRVQLSDKGHYTCFVRSGPEYDEVVVELKVTASGSAPLIALQHYQDGGISVACRSAGWFPQPQLLWRDPHGHWLPPLSEHVTQDEDGLYTAESTLVLAGGVSRELACMVKAALHSQEKESAFSIAGKYEKKMGKLQFAVNWKTQELSPVALMGHYHKGGVLEANGGGADVPGGAPHPSVLIHCFAEKQAEELVWRRFAVPIEDAKVILDPDTAHCDLVLADDGRSVKRTDRRQDVPSCPERFDPWRCVLGCQGFVAGRHCWEVEVVLDGGGWTVGVSREDVRRKGEIEFGPEEGIWAVGKWAGQFQAQCSVRKWHSFIPHHMHQVTNQKCAL
ncbi:hypothetical protein ASZ78_008119 [Callipepla squamata]|uniref:Ig-like domain-containing protein n=1 Tax=Callipepla squamata TaxID=9009 RepID=A0A226MXB3_CALSU|nr:hypothetical protein ASZ78_008119 [Callipepla squamata]